MRIGFVLFAVVVLGGSAVNTSYAQQPPQATANAGAKPAPPKFVAAVAPRRGTLGGPVNKGPGINGTGIQPKH
jgi:hypothetical protein